MGVRSVVDSSMRITDGHVAEFQRLYLETFKEEISHADAHARLVGLTWLYRNLVEYGRKASISPPREGERGQAADTD